MIKEERRVIIEKEIWKFLPYQIGREIIERLIEADEMEEKLKSMRCENGDDYICQSKMKSVSYLTTHREVYKKVTQ